MPENPKGQSPSNLMRGLERQSTTRQYTGTLADADARSLITRTYSTTKEEAAAVDRVVGSPQTLYMSHGDFVRHAVWEMLMAFEDSGFPDDYIPDVVMHLRDMREAAHRLRLRQQFSDVLMVYETSLTDGLETGDFDLVQATFETLEGYLTRTPDEHWRHYLQRTILRSGVIKAAVDALFEVGRLEAQYADKAEKWLLWLEGLAE